MTRSRLAFAAAFAFATLLSAPLAMAADPFTKEHLAAARAAIDASHVADGFDKVLLGVAQQTKATLIRNNPSFSSQIEAATNKVAIQLAVERPTLDKEIQQVWCSKFSQAELMEIAKFYNSPIGQKLAKETGAMVAQTVPIVQGYQKKLEQDMFKLVPEELKKQGLPF